MATIVLIKYGRGNLLSLTRAIEQAGYTVRITSEPQDILAAEKVILPGVGAFNDAMISLKQLKLDQALREYISRGKPFLGVCLGMQLLFEESEEFGLQQGLGILSGRIIKISVPQNEPHQYKIPHIGWNELHATKSWQQTILEEIPDQSAVYFMHSYHARPTNSDVVLATTRYANQDIVSVVHQKNIWGCQFHPEKSGGVGLRMITSFLTQKMDG